SQIPSGGQGVQGTAAVSPPNEDVQILGLWSDSRKDMTRIGTADEKRYLRFIEDGDSVLVEGTGCRLKIDRFQELGLHVVVPGARLDPDDGSRAAAHEATRLLPFEESAVYPYLQRPVRNTLVAKAMPRGTNLATRVCSSALRPLPAIAEG